MVHWDTCILYPVFNIIISKNHSLSYFCSTSCNVFSHDTKSIFTLQTSSVMCEKVCHKMSSLLNKGKIRMMIEKKSGSTCDKLHRQEFHYQLLQIRVFPVKPDQPWDTFCHIHHVVVRLVCLGWEAVWAQRNVQERPLMPCCAHQKAFQAVYFESGLFVLHQKFIKTDTFSIHPKHKCTHGTSVNCTLSGSLLDHCSALEAELFGKFK